MSYGFLINTGTGSLAEIVSSDEVPGIELDFFKLTYVINSVTTKSYPSFNGTSIYVAVIPDGGFPSTYPATDTNISASVNDSTKTITLTCLPGFGSAVQVDAYILVIGI
jgi:hypothetical protein